MDSEPGAPTTAELFENFCFMVVEEFLMKKNLKHTLFSFKQEWKRPNEEISMLSWYEVALKLRLPELINSGVKTACILENLVTALVQESSVKNRRTADVTVSGLATLPKNQSLPSITDGSIPSPTRRPNSARFYDSEQQRADQELAAVQQRLDLQNSRNTITIRRQYDPEDAKVYISNKVDAKSKLLSNEAWVPDDFRVKSLMRDLAVAKVTYSDIRNLELGQQREMKRLNISDLERAKFEESLNTTHKVPCACCLKPFLYVNLPLKVSRKAIIDIRIKWSGKLSSATVFGDTGALLDDDLAGVLEGSTTGGSAHGGGGGSPTKKGGKKGGAALLNNVPRCYDEVGVCVFCAQFFHVQEEYRPSFQMITYQERRAEHFANKKKEREYWDPLEMIKRDRDAVDRHNQQYGTQGLAGGGGGGTAGGGAGLGNTGSLTDISS